MTGNPVYLELYEAASRAHDALASLTNSREERLTNAVTELGPIHEHTGRASMRVLELFSQIMSSFPGGESVRERVSEMSEAELADIEAAIRNLRYEATAAYFGVGASERES